MDFISVATAVSWASILVYISGKGECDMFIALEGQGFF